MTKISYFKNVEDNIPKEFELDKWLSLTIHPTEELENLVEHYRNTLQRTDKEKIPCVTISATFNNRRGLEDIKQQNNFIVLDVDRFSKSVKAKSNPFINFLLLKEYFMGHPSCYYCGYSTSGDGVYIVMKINNYKLFDEYFLFFQERLAHIGVNIDNSCKDLTRLRFFSIDKEAYYNPDALAYKMPSEVKKKEVKKSFTSLSDIEKVETIVNLIELQNIDITSNYADWIRVGAALYNIFGDSGEDYFHRLSNKHPQYKYKATQDKFKSCKRLSNTKINALLGIASDHGIRY